MKLPVFDVIHGWMQFIKENTNCMAFWGNARIFSSNIFGQPFLDGVSTKVGGELTTERANGQHVSSQYDE